jgi:hypothetical protein
MLTGPVVTRTYKSIVLALYAERNYNRRLSPVSLNGVGAFQNNDCGGMAIICSLHRDLCRKTRKMSTEETAMISGLSSFGQGNS